MIRVDVELFFLLEPEAEPDIPEVTPPDLPLPFPVREAAEAPDFFWGRGVTDRDLEVVAIEIVLSIPSSSSSSTSRIALLS